MLQPRYSNRDGNTQLQFMASFGTGRIGIVQEDYETEHLDNSYYASALGGRKLLHSSRGIFGPMELELTGRAWSAQQTAYSDDAIIRHLESRIGHAHVKLTGRESFSLKDHIGIEPWISVASGGDSQNAGMKYTVNIASGIDYQDQRGLAVSGEGHVSLTKTGNEQEWGLESEFIYDPGNDKIGLQLQVSPFWGWLPNSISDTKFENSWAGNSLHLEESSYSNSLKTRMGFGTPIPAWDAILTPNAGFDLAKNRDRIFLIGSSVSAGAGFSLELKGNYTLQGEGKNEFGTILHSRFNW